MGTIKIHFSSHQSFEIMHRFQPQTPKATNTYTPKGNQITKTPFMKKLMLSLLVAFAFMVSLPILGIAQPYYWTGGTPGSTNAVGGTGTWSVANGFKTAATGGSNYTWSNSATNNAVLANTAGTVTYSGTLTAGTINVNTTGYVLQQSSSSNYVFTGNIVLANNVALKINLSYAGSSSNTFNGGISGGTGSSLILNGVNAGTANTYQRLECGTTNSLSVPVTITAGATGSSTWAGGTTLAANTFANISRVGFAAETGTSTTFTISNTVTNNSAAFTMLGSSSDVLNVSGVVSGSSGVAVMSSSTGSGSTTTIFNAQHTYAGPTLISGSSITLRTAINNVFPSGNNLYIAANTGAGGGSLDLYGTSQTLGTLNSLSNGGTVSGSVTNSGGSGGTTAGSLTLTGSINSSFALAINDGTGKVSLANTGSGTFSLSKASSFSGGLSVSGGGTFQAGIASVCTGTPSLTLGAGSGSAGTYSTGATTGYTNTLGTLTMNAGGGTIALGTGSHTLNFTGVPATWAGNLTITGWTGSTSGGTGGQIIIAGTSLTNTQLSQITFTSPTGFTYTGAQQLATGEIVPATITTPYASGLSAVAGSDAHSAVLNWTNPSAAFTGVIVVASSAAFTGILPSNDASTFTANSSFTGGGSAFNGGVVVYSSTSQSGSGTVTVTGLTTGTTYYFEVIGYNGSTGTTWQTISSSGTASCVATSTNYYWNQGSGGGTWNTTNSFFGNGSVGGTSASWPASGSTYSAYFTNNSPAAAGNVTLGSSITANSTNFTVNGYSLTTAAYTLTSPIVIGANGSSNVGLTINNPASTAFILTGSVNAATGSTGSNLTINGSGVTAAGNYSRLELNSPGSSINVPITITSGAPASGTTVNATTLTGSISQVGFSVYSGTYTINSSITNNSNSYSLISATNPYTLIVNGAVSGTSGLLMCSSIPGNGAGTTIFNAANSYQGPTVICGSGAACTFKTGIAGALPTGNNVYIAATATNATGGTIDLYGTNQSIASLNTITQGGTLAGGVTNTGGSGGSTAGTLTITGSSNSSFGLGINNGTGTTALAITGSGTFALSASSSFSGGLSVSGGGTFQAGIAGVLTGAPNVTLGDASTSGKFNTGATTGYTNTNSLGTLTVNAGGGTIALGAGSHALTFASGPTLTGTLTITGWVGTTAGGTSGVIKIGTTNSLTTAQLNNISFKAPSGYSFSGAQQLSTGEIVPASVTVTSVANLAAVAGSDNVSAILSWANPTSTFTGVIVVASASPFSSSSPSSAGSTFSVNSTSFSDATNATFDGGVVIYNGTGTGVTVTGLNSGTTYYFEAFAYIGSTWTAVSSTSCLTNTNNYYWNQGTGTWNTSSSYWSPAAPGNTPTISWPSSTGANYNAYFTGTSPAIAGNITLGSSITANSTNFSVNGYSLTTAAYTLTSPIVIGANGSSNVGLTVNNPASTAFILTGSINAATGSTGSKLTINGSTVTAAGNYSRVELNSPGSSINVPITITSGAPASGTTVNATTLTGTISQVGLTCYNGTYTINSSITNNSNSYSIISATNPYKLVVNGAVGGSSGVMLCSSTPGNGAGTTQFNAVNTYSGPTVICGSGSACTLQTGIAGALPSGNNLYIASAGTSTGGTLDLYGTNQSIGTLNTVVSSGTLTGGVTNSSATAASLTITGSTSSSFGLGINNGTGTTALSITGSGVFSLSAVSSFSGGLSISGGGTFQSGVAGVLTGVPNVTLGDASTVGKLSTGATTGYTNTNSLGTLTINAGGGTIALGSGSHLLTFSGVPSTWGGNLIITGWAGTTSGGTAGQIFIGSSQVLTSTQLSQITFTAPSGFSYTGAQQLSTGEIVPATITTTLAGGLTAVSGSDAHSAVLNWTNPSTTYTGVIVVASSSAFTGILPPSDASTYTANSSFTGGGTAFNGGVVVYSSTSQAGSGTVTVTGLTTNTTYYFEVIGYIGSTGTTWQTIATTGTASCIPTSTNYYWTQGSGGGTWNTTNSYWGVGSVSGTAAAWPSSGATYNAYFTNTSPATAGTVTMGSSLTANNIYFNTTGYTLATTVNETLTGNIVLANSVALIINLTDAASSSLSFEGAISGGAGSSLTINAPASVGNFYERLECGTNNALSIPVTLTTASSTWSQGTTLTASNYNTIGRIGFSGETGTSSTIFTISGGITNNSAAYTMLGDATGNLVISGSLSGSSGVAITSSSPGSGSTGSTTFSAVNTYTGPTLISGSAVTEVLKMGINNVFNGATGNNVYIGAPSSGNGGTIDLNGTNQTIASLNTLGNAVIVGSVTNTNASASTLTITGAGSQNSSFGLGINNGTGTVALNITGGKFALSKASSFSGGLSVSGGGSFQAGVASVFSGAPNLTLGNASTAGTYSSGSSTGYANTFGTLTVNVGGGTIALGTGSHTLTFADSHTQTWNGTLTITGWSGTTGSTGSGTAGQIYVGTTNAALTSTQLSHITFNGYAPGAAITSTGQIVPATPVVSVSGTLTALNTAYGTAGTASATTQSFSVSGTNIYSGITVTPPAGFEVSQTSSSTGFAGSGTAITISGTGTISATTVFVRLASVATIAGSPYSGNIVCSSTYATNVNVATSNSSVTKAVLTIIANSQSNVSYGTDPLTVTGNGSYTVSGFQGSDNSSVISGSVTYTTSYTSSSTVGASGLTITPVVTGLSATNYTFTTSSGSISVSASVPGAPVSATAADDNAQASISYVAPSNNGGSPIDYYVITAIPASGSNIVKSNITASPYTFTGLTNGVAYTFTVAAHNAAGIGAVATTNQITPSSTTTWNGTSWSATAPDATQSGVIAANLNSNNVNGTFSTCAGLTINAGVTFTLNSNVTVNGAFVNNGTITGTGTLILAGGTAQTIAGTGTISSLTLSTSGTVATITGAQNITGILKVNTGTTLNTGNNLTLKSTSVTNTAIVDKVLGSITGTATVERYIPLGFLGYRDMAPEVYSATNTIASTWQEGATSGASNSVASNPKSGYGIFITGPSAAYTDASNAGAIDANGFDKSGTGGSLNSQDYTYVPTYDNPTTGYGHFKAFDNTSANLDAFKGYRLLIRGDRSPNLYTTNINEVGNTANGRLMYNATTLRATGKLITGDVTYNYDGIVNAATGVNTTTTGTAPTSTHANALNTTTNGFSLVANPYVCPVQWSSVYTASGGAATSNINGSYWYLDPTSSATGKYIAYNALTGSASTAAGTTYFDLNGVQQTYTGTTVLGYIQPGQAVFVQSLGATPQVIFQETAKAASSTKAEVFGTSNLSKLYVGLLKQATGASTYNKVDGAAVAFRSDFGNKVYGPQDALKFASANDNLFISDKGKNLSIDGRLPATATDAIAVAISKPSATAYQLSIDATNYVSNGFEPVLYDGYKNTTKVLGTGATTIDFTVDAANTATYQNRFTLLFAPSALPVNSIVASASLNNKLATINWKTVGEKNVDHYEVEKSTNAVTFTKIGQATAKNTATASYSTTDNNVVTTTYYRIKAVSTTGAVNYSNIAKLTTNNSPLITVYPNPLVGKTLNVQVANVAAGKYVVSIYNVLGEKVVEQAISHNGGSTTHALTINNTLARGIYSVTIREASSNQIVHQTSLSVQP